MRLFLLSLLAIGSAQALTLGNPYRSAYWAYNPARGEFPVQSSVLHGYLRYIDNNGNERFVTYNYPEPVYGIRQPSFENNGQADSSSVLRTFGQDESIEFAKAREAHFRAWALQQYRALKCEMDALRAEGKEPSADLYSKFRPLEKIALTADYAEISHMPEIKRIGQDHLQIWNEVRNKNLQTEAGHSTYQQSFANDIRGEFKTYNGQPSSTLVTVEGTPEQKQAHDEHLRIHSEQIAQLRKLEEQHQHQQQFEQKPAGQQPQQAEALAEFERAKQEHLRLWNEAKLRAEQASFDIHEITETGHKEYQGAEKQQISALKHEQSQSSYHQEHSNQQSAEIQKAHDDHLRLVSEATQKIHSAGEQNKQYEQQNLKTSHDSTIQTTEQLAGYSDQLTEIERAKQEHLRLWNEAKLRGEQASSNIHAHNYEQSQQNLKTSQVYISPATEQQAGHSDQLTEIERAKQEHLRLWNEAKLRAEQASSNIDSAKYEQSQQNLKTSQVYISPATEQQAGHSDQLTEIERAKLEHLRLWNEAKLRAEQASSSTLDTAKHDQSIYQQQHINQESDEIQKARAEHLRLVNEATQRIHAAEEHTKQIEQGILKHDDITETNQNQQILDTPEVQQARLEHLRLVNEANIKAQIAEQQELKQQQQSSQHIGEQFKYIPAKIETGTQVHETAGNQPISELKYDQNIGQQQHRDHADFQKAHDDHIRLVNEATLKIKTAEEHIKQLATAEQMATAESQSHQSIEQTHLKSTSPTEQQQDTPEVKQAREEHLRLVNEAKLRAESVEQKEQKYKQENVQESHQVPLLKTQYQPIHFQQQQENAYHYDQPSIPYTPEVIKAREEHLRLVNEAKLNAKIEDQNAHSLTEQQSNLKHHSLHIEQQQGANEYNQFHLKDTPEVIKAREEHLRLFNQAIGDQNAQYNAQEQTKFKSHSYQENYQQQGFQQSSETHHHIEETPEVKQAREEHLRIFNSVKSLSEQEGAKAAELKSTDIIEHLENIKDEESLKEETRLLELQGLREAERLQEQHRLLELERIREAERLAGEQQQIKAELQLLKSEEDKRFQMEKLQEQEEEKLQQLRLFNQAIGDQNAQYNAQEQTKFKSHSYQENYQQQGFQQSSETHHHIEETPEVKQAREEHLRIFNSVKSLSEQEGAKAAELKSTDIIEHLENIKDEESLKEETRLLELEGLREAGRLQEQHRLLELERRREAERLAGEQQQIKAELQLLKSEEDKRFQMEKLQEQEELQKLQQLKTEEYQKAENQVASALIQPQITIIPYTQPIAITLEQINTQQQQQQQQHKYFANNPYLRANPIQSQVVNHVQHSFSNQQQQGQQLSYGQNPFLKTGSLKTPIVYYPIALAPNKGAVQQTTIPLIPVARYIQTSQHLNTGSKQQHNKDDFLKNKFTNIASTQPADTAVALSAIQRATSDHFRAHEQALEHLRLARLQDPDCN